MWTLTHISVSFIPWAGFRLVPTRRFYSSMSHVRTHGSNYYLLVLIFKQILWSAGIRNVIQVINRLFRTSRTPISLGTCQTVMIWCFVSGEDGGGVDADIVDFGSFLPSRNDQVCQKNSFKLHIFSHLALIWDLVSAGSTFYVLKSPALITHLSGCQSTSVHIHRHSCIPSITSHQRIMGEKKHPTKIQQTNI